MDRLDPYKRVLFIGGTTCGKTTGIMHFMKHMHLQGKRMKCKAHEEVCKTHKARFCAVCGNCKACRETAHGIQLPIGFSNTERANGNLGGPMRDKDGNVTSKYAIMPQFCARHGFDEELLRAAMDYQMATKAVARGKNMVVVFDDLLSQKGIKNNATVSEYIQNARNYKSGLVVASHNPTQLAPQMRDSIQFVVCYELAEESMKSFYKFYASRAFKTFKKFINTWKRISKDLGKYWAMVIDLQCGGDLNNRVFKFRAPNPDADDYHIPHFGEKGLWWVQHKLHKKQGPTKTAAELFDIEALAKAQGLATAAHRRAQGARKGSKAAARAREVEEEEEEEVDELFV